MTHIYRYLTEDLDGPDDAPPPPTAIRTARERLRAWADIGGSWTNAVHADGALYFWDTRPRAQKNGALIGRVYRKAPNETPRDIGHYKIDADGAVLELPEELRPILG